MKIVRCELKNAPVELIDRLAGNYFFSSTAFAKLWESMGGRPVYWLAEEGGKVLAVLPGVEFGHGSLRRFQAMPNGCYGRVLHVEMNYEDVILFSGEIARIQRSWGYAKVIINDFYKSFANLQKFDIEEYSTHLVNISAPDWQPPDSKLRQQIHKAEKEGLEIMPFNASGHLTDFMKLVELHEMRRKTKSRYTRAFFNALAKLALTDDRIQWVWCEHDKKPVESSIFFREGNSLIHWQMYYDEAMSHLQATKLIPYQIAKEAQKSGITNLNLGASPPEAEGAEFYKSKWGGELYTYNCYVHKNLLGRLW